MKGVEQIEHTLHNLRSPKRSHTFWGWLAVMGIAFLLLLPRHSQWLQSPNDFIFGESPDGFKNYMTSAWHVTHDSSYVHYGGMGYPYGEHVLFTDNQPMVSALMQWWSWHISDLTGHTVGIVNLVQVLSLVFGAGIIFLLFRKLHLPVWYAGLVALGVLFLSPQYNRFDGHFGLSHTWVFPLLLLLLCRYEERHSRRYQSLQIGALVWFAAQLHFYYFGISALFLGLYTLVQLLIDPSLRNLRVRLSHLVVMVLLPFVALNIWIHWSDYTTDRPASPWGFTTYIGYWEGVLLPYKEFPLYKWIDENIIHIRRVDYETQAYVGLGGLILTLRLLFRRFRLFEPEWDEAAYHRVHKRHLRGIFTAAFVLLIFACGFPFAIKGLEWMADYFGPFRQFRGLGRFTWAYYYVMNVLLFYLAWNYSVRFKGFLKKEEPNSPDEPKSNVVNLSFDSPPTPPSKGRGDVKGTPFLSRLPSLWREGPGVGRMDGAKPYLKLTALDPKPSDESIPNSESHSQHAVPRTPPTFQYPWFRWVIALLPVVVLAYEAYIYQTTRRLPLGPNIAQRSMAVQAYPWIDKVDFAPYQALMPLPYYHVGSENIWLDLDGQHFRRMQTTGLHTGVADMGVNMSRTSVGHMVKSMQFALNPCEPPELLEEFPDNRPIALMINPAKWDEVREKYSHLIAKAVPVYEHPDMKIMSLVPDSMRVYSRRQALEMSAEMDNIAAFSAGKNWKSDQEPKWFAHLSYDSLASTERVFQGGGAYKGNMGDTTWLWNSNIPKGEYFLSLWIYVKQDMGMTHEAKIIQNSQADGHEINFRHEGLRFYLRTIVDGWALYDLAFSVYEDNSNVRIFLNKEGVFEPFYLDEVMIKRYDFSLYRRVPGWTVRNNFWYKMPDR